MSQYNLAKEKKKDIEEELSWLADLDNQKLKGKYYAVLKEELESLKEEISYIREEYEIKDEENKKEEEK